MSISIDFKMQKCLILGGDGFLGSHLADKLLNRRHNIKIFGRFQHGKTKNLGHINDKVTLISGDFLDPLSLEKALENKDYVFHLISASNPASTIGKPIDELELNILPTIRLLEMCVKKGVKKIIFPSSGGSIYGDLPKGAASETDLSNPISPHAIAKLYIEKLLHYYFVQFGLDYLIYRISNIYGERQNIQKGQGIISTIIYKALKKEVIKIYGNTTRDYIYINDVASFIASNFDKEHKFRIYNLGSGEGITLEKLLKTIKSETGLPMNIKKLDRRECDIKRIVLNISRIKNEFGFCQEIKLKEGIRRTYKNIQHYFL